jgi:predicted DNA binding protein
MEHHMALSRDQILAMDDIKTISVTVPEWNNEVVLIRGLTGAARDEFEATNRRNGDQNLNNVRARFLVRCIVNEGGTRIFADQDAAALGKKSSAAIDRLWDVATDLNGSSEKAVEELEGNSETTGTEDGSDSSSPSPETSE